MTFFPYEYMKDNKPAGFDIEFLDGLAKVMGRQAVNIDTRFPNLITGLQSNRFDITNSSMYITADRMKVIDMIPYLKSGEAILSLKGSDYQPKTPEEFCGHKIGSMGATSWLQQLHKLSDDYCVKNGKPPIAISEICDRSSDDSGDAFPCGGSADHRCRGGAWRCPEAGRPHPDIFHDAHLSRIKRFRREEGQYGGETGPGCGAGSLQ